jgi:hypothetical protein
LNCFSVLDYIAWCLEFFWILGLARAWSLAHFQKWTRSIYSKACTTSIMNRSTVKCHCGIESLIDLVRFGVCDIIFISWRENPSLLIVHIISTHRTHIIQFASSTPSLPSQGIRLIYLCKRSPCTDVSHQRPRSPQHNLSSKSATVSSPARVWHMRMQGESRTEISSHICRLQHLDCQILIHLPHNLNRISRLEMRLL